MATLKSFTAGLALLAAPCLFGTAAASAATSTVNNAAGAEAAARCIAQGLPRSAQFWRASDASFRVLSIGRRGNVARWKFTGAAGAVQIDQAGGTAGLARNLSGICA